MQKKAFWLAVIILVLLWTGWAQAQSTGPPVTGIYDLTPVDALEAGPELGKPEVAGLSARFRWKSIQPQKNKYDWRPIDRIIASARSYGKQVILKVNPGINTPTWVYAEGAKYVTYSEGGTIYKIPVPWDPVYLQYWLQFIDAFGARYKSIPDVISISMAGVGKAGEMGIYITKVNWANYGYTDDVYINAWKTVIDAFRRGFPNKVTQLSIHEPYKMKSNVMMNVVNYCTTTYSHLVFIQANDLRSVGSYYSQYIREAGQKTFTGYQMFGGREWLDTDTGGRLTAFQLGLADGVSYVEVYQGDLQDETLAEAIQFLAGGLTANAAR